MTAKLAGRAGALTLAAATTVALAGCGGVGAKLTYDDTEKVKVTAIVIDGGSGDVVVRTAAITETHIKRIYRVSADPDETYRLDGTELHIANRCGHNCRVSYEIETPPGVAVRGELTSGDVVLTDVGATDLSLTSGDVMVRDATGPVKIKATSGDITVDDAAAGVNVDATSGDVHVVNVNGPVVAKVTSGDAAVRLNAPASVTAQTNSGDLIVSIPQGSYQLRTHKGSGDLHVDGVITNDAKAKNIIDVRVGSGDLTVATTG